MYEVKGNETIEELKKQDKLSFLGKPLVPNFFKQAPLSVQFEGMQGVAYVQVADRWHLLSACPLVGSNWCVVGVRLVLFDEEWGNRFLHPQRFDREGLERLRREVKEDPSSPQVFWPQLTAKPVFQLTDYHGGFGKLLVDWGDGKLVVGGAGEKDLLEVGF
ncbi:MAG: hypothetical protein JSR80_05910, partial [Verrucomicrobia bacterium]|nr:hypothetical protein [Verrucomicrobiota bacterium]